MRLNRIKLFPPDRRHILIVIQFEYISNMKYISNRGGGDTYGGDTTKNAIMSIPLFCLIKNLVHTLATSKVLGK
jgi:hypothetical protein